MIIITRHDGVLDLGVFAGPDVVDVDHANAAVRLVTVVGRELAHADVRAERLVEHERGRPVRAVLRSPGLRPAKHQARVHGGAHQFRANGLSPGERVSVHAHRAPVPLHRHTDRGQRTAGPGPWPSTNVTRNDRGATVASHDRVAHDDIRPAPNARKRRDPQHPSVAVTADFSEHGTIMPPRRFPFSRLTNTRSISRLFAQKSSRKMRFPQEHTRSRTHSMDSDVEINDYFVPTMN